MDARVEHEIHDALRGVMAGRTTLLIAHRQSTLALADRIAVLDGGRLADIGTHEELTGRCALYRKLLTDPDELGEVERDPAGMAVHDAHDTVEGITPGLWRREEDDAQGEGSGAGTSGVAAAQAGRPGTFASELAGLPGSPELLAKVAALPPADDVPDIDEERAEQPEKSYGLRRLLHGFGAALIVALVFAALDAGFGLLLPVLIRHGIDDGVEKGALGAVWFASGVALAVVVAQWGAQIGSLLLTGRTGERVLYALRVKIFAQLQRLGLDYYERHQAGAVMTRMTTDVDALSTFLQTGLVTAVVSLFTFLGIMGALLFLDLQLALVVFATLPLLVVGTVFFRRHSVRAYELARERVSRVNADLQESVAGLRMVQAYRAEERGADRFERRSDGYRQARVRGQWLISVYFPFVQLLASLATAAVLVVGASRIENGTLTAGALVAYLLYIELFFAPVQQLSQVFDGYQQAAVSLRRIQELLRERSSTPLPEAPRPVSKLRGEITFRGVDFRYATADPAAPPGRARSGALSDIDLTVQAGQTVAFGGPRTGRGQVQPSSSSWPGSTTPARVPSWWTDTTCGRSI
ncbi:hypothetical protein TPA0909_60940 [Streptomyces albus]|nr:hypothetical protein TPA0909_60940 [Streptomyces albus]